MEEKQASEQQAATAKPAEVPARTRRLRRVLLRLFAVVVAIVAAVLITVLTFDLGPDLREMAEREGTKYMERPMHIGRLSAKLTPGVFVIEDLLIEGLTPTDRPFLKAKKIEVRVPWWTAISRKLVVESVTMTDWEMLVEAWAGGRHSFPKVTPKNPRKGPSTFTTTLRYVLATRGQFTYDDHGTPWSTVARNLTLQLHRSGPTSDYRGRATISNGTVRIQSYQPFRMDMQSRFSLNGGKVHFDRMDLVSDGARTVATGDVDLGRWPEQIYQLKSRIDFPTQKEIFFHGQKFGVSGVGDFTGTFHLFKGGRELKGSFVSALAGVNDWRFPNLRGSVLWVPDRMDITNATSELYGGTARFDYRMAPFGKPTPARATWDVEYEDVDLVRLSDFLEIAGLRMAGRASGRNRLEWPLGKWALKTGQGEATVEAPPDVRPMTRELPADLVAELSALPDEAGPFNPHLSLGHVPIAGQIVYALDPQWIRLKKSWVATSRTYVEFEGQTAFGEQSRIPFHVSSLDWQESDRVLAGIMTAFGSPTGAVPMGGYGEFDGVLLEAFKRPRIQGSLKGERFRAWDVVWGTGRADLAIENSYVFVANATLTAGDSEIRADGQFSLGFPRRDGGDEIDARVRVTRRPLVDLRHAFNLDDYPIEGTVSGEYQLYGKYQTPFGFGRLNIEKGTAYGETFDSAISSLRFEGAGVRLDNIDIRKSTGGVTGAAYVGWDGNYSFNADGARVPVESLVSVVVSARTALRPAAVHRDGRRHFRRAALRRQAGRRRLVCRRRGHRAALGTAQPARRSPDARSRSGVGPPRRLRLGPDCAHRRDGRRADGALPRDVARSLRAILRAAPLALYDRDRRRHHARRRRARQSRPAGRRYQDRAARPQAVRLSRPQRRPDRADARPERPRHRPVPSRRRGHAAAARRPARAEGPDARPAGDGRREPRHPAGVLPHAAQPRYRRPQGAADRHLQPAGVFRQRHDHRRAAAAFLAAALARSRSTAGYRSTRAVSASTR